MDSVESLIFRYNVSIGGWENGVLEPGNSLASNLRVIVEESVLEMFFFSSRRKLYHCKLHIVPGKHGRTQHLQRQVSQFILAIDGLAQNNADFSCCRAIADGHGSYLEAFNYGLNEWQKEEDPAEAGGVCAVVQLKLKQSVTLTREAFQVHNPYLALDIDLTVYPY